MSCVPSIQGAVTVRRSLTGRIAVVATFVSFITLLVSSSAFAYAGSNPVTRPENWTSVYQNFLAPGSTPPSVPSSLPGQTAR